MKDHETKLAFIRSRAEGKSYSTISKELGIAKATCTSWESSFKGDIEALRRAQLEELYTTYNMGRKARIQALGTILQDIETSIQERIATELGDLPLDKLLELRLKYARELKAEYVEPVEVDTDNTLDGLLEQYNQLYKDSKENKYTPADIKAQLAILDAKRDTMYKICGEQEREEAGGLFVDLTADYTSRLLRKEA